MKTKGIGGEKTLTGLVFENKVDLQNLIANIPGYTLRPIPGKAGLGVFFKETFVARCFRKFTFYGFLEEEGIDWKARISKRILPDDAILVIVRNTLFIIEVKYQQVAGSVDEKLQTCDFKRKQYIKLVSSLGLKVEYVYVLCEWFRKPEYKDVLEYIRSVNCEYVFDEIPLKWLGLPTIENEEMNYRNGVVRKQGLCDNCIMGNNQLLLFGQTTTDAKPFLKWAGGKTQLLEQLAPLFPRRFQNYFEPFVGGGAVLFHLMGQRNKGDIDFTQASITDANIELINTYRTVKNHVNELVDCLQKLKEEHNKETYYKIRAIQPGSISEVERAARFIYLNKTCFNGLYRVNRNGQFNVPMGDYKNPQIFTKENLFAVSQSLQDVTADVAQFSEVIEKATKGDFVYFDPPYYPLSKTSSFTSYTDLPFGDKEQIELRDLVVNLTKNGVLVMLSNSWAEFILDLYKDFKRLEVKAARMINSNSEKRGAISELVVLNY